MSAMPAPDIQPDRSAGEERRPLELFHPTPDRLETRSFDPTQGRQIGSDPYDDPTAGRQIGSPAFDDPTQGRQIGSRPSDDPTRAGGRAA